jgi:hypothetical protein
MAAAAGDGGGRSTPVPIIMAAEGTENTPPPGVASAGLDGGAPWWNTEPPNIGWCCCWGWGSSAPVRMLLPPW